MRASRFCPTGILAPDRFSSVRQFKTYLSQHHSSRHVYYNTTVPTACLPHTCSTGCMDPSHTCGVNPHPWHYAAPPSSLSRWFNRDGEEASAKWQPHMRSSYCGRSTCTEPPGALSSALSPGGVAALNRITLTPPGSAAGQRELHGGPAPPVG